MSDIETQRAIQALAAQIRNIAQSGVIVEIDFDIAIIGCGAYGFPLAAHVKRKGKQAIHMGGATQILFGIKGNRWEEHDIISKLFNEHWIRPNKNETPKNSGNIEDACYW